MEAKGVFSFPVYQLRGIKFDAHNTFHFIKKSFRPCVHFLKHKNFLVYRLKSL